MTTPPRDEELMAFADGALPPAEIRRIEALAAGDERLRNRIEMFRATRKLAADALSPLAAEPVPADLENTVRAMLAESETPKAEASETAVVAFRPKVSNNARGWQWPMQVAASLGVVAAGLGGYALGTSTSSAPQGLMTAVGGELPEAISTILSKEASGSEVLLEGTRVRLIASVKSQDGTLCREFELDLLALRQTSLGVACRQDKAWRLDIAMAAPAGDDGYAPAASTSVLDSYLAAIGASAALEPEEERRALR